MNFSLNDLKSKCAEFDLILDENQLLCLKKYGEMLYEWNQKMNLTAITEENEVNLKHFFDSLLIFKYCDIPVGAKVVDVGTGAGFPGLVMKIARPDIDIWLLDSLKKRLGFLDAVSAELGIETHTVHIRAEEGSKKPEFRESFDVAVSRAVAAMPVLCELCIPYVKKGGQFLAMKGSAGREETAAAKNAISVLGGGLEEFFEYELPTGDKRTIAEIKKLSQTSPKYPRKNTEISKSSL